LSSASGTYAASSGTAALDVDGDGTIQTPEQTVPVVDSSTTKPVDYTVKYLSWSIGANYLAKPNLGLFARVSEGGRANAERLLFGGGIRDDGSIAKQVAVNTIRQYESGIKWRTSYTRTHLTLFHAETSIVNQDVTSVTNPFTNQSFEARGFELETELYWNNYTFYTGLTYTDSEIVKDQLNPDRVGKPTAADFLYQFALDYNSRQFAAGISLIGTTDTPFGSGGVIAPAFTQVNAYSAYEPLGGFKLILSANNLFNTIGITEIPDSTTAINSSGVARARSIEGRTLNLQLEYSF
jgi:outer membrane receptor protein involved in Fe transport